MRLATATRRIDAVERLLRDRPAPCPEYAADPVGFARDHLKATWTPQQAAVAMALTQPPYRVAVKAAHSVGKTMLAAGIALWWHLTRRPAIVITTAPKMEQVKRLLWKEIRRQAAGLPVTFDGPAACVASRAVDDFMLGTTAASGTGFQGHHGVSMLFIFDEAVGVKPEFFHVTNTMFRSEPGFAWLCIYNPTDTTQQMYAEEQAIGADGRPKWHVIDLPATAHPNVLAELRNDPPPIPAAVTLRQLEDGLAEDCTPVEAGRHEPTDLEWPPGSGRWLRPGPVAESRWLARWPSQGTYGVWSDGLWAAVLAARLPEPTDQPVEIGCDVARHGDDRTAIVVRRGPVALHHESHNGWETGQTAARLKQLADHYGPRCGRLGTAVLVKVDPDGMGWGVIDQRGGYRFAPVSSGSAARAPSRYRNRRSELWFDLAERAKEGRLDVSRLSPAAVAEIRRQAMGVTWRPDAQGRRVVEPKDETKARLGRSPDDFDALALAFYSWDDGPIPVVAKPAGPQAVPPKERSAMQRRGAYGGNR